jgi:hypothetical protein
MCVAPTQWGRASNLTGWQLQKATDLSRQLGVNLASVDVHLSDDEMNRLTAVSHVSAAHPYDQFIDQAQQGR